MHIDNVFCQLNCSFIDAYTHTDTMTDRKYNVAYLLKHSSFVDLLSGDVTHLQDTQGKGFEGWLLNQIGVMDVQAGKHSLRQGVTLQPCDLGIHTNMDT